MRNAAQRDAISQGQEREDRCRWRARDLERRRRMMENGEGWVERHRAEKRFGIDGKPARRGAHEAADGLTEQRRKIVNE
jgi:hypothetical protein